MSVRDGLFLTLKSFELWTKALLKQGQWSGFGQAAVFPKEDFFLTGAFPCLIQAQGWGCSFRIIHRGFAAGPFFGRARWVIFKLVFYSCLCAS